MDKNAIKVGINLDNCITAEQEFLRVMCHLLCPEYEIHLITNRDEDSRAKTMKELEKYRIQYSQLVMTDNKAEYLQEQGIEIKVN
jgi:hypothetical protein